ncbi:MAG: heparan-alpha-glucosaminide N-acetyltransferase domain-containing protein, partial [Rubrivivax sp.]
YVPVLPWLGVMLIGLVTGQWLLSKRSTWLAGPVPGPARALVLLGRWPLTFYMLHQPVFIGLLVVLKMLR